MCILYGRPVCGPVPTATPLPTVTLLAKENPFHVNVPFYNTDSRLLFTEQIMTRVNRMTAYEFQSSSAKMNKKKQIPSITTRLTAEVYFPYKFTEERVELDYGPVEVRT